MTCLNVVNGYNDITEFKQSYKKKPSEIFEKCRTSYNRIHHYFENTYEKFKLENKSKGNYPQMSDWVTEWENWWNSMDLPSDKDFKTCLEKFEV